MQVPILDLKPHHQPIIDEIKKEINEVIDTNRFIMGPKIEELEKNSAAYSGSKYALGVSSGTDALILALMALDISAGDEVITTPYSFFATAGAIARVGAKPVLADIDPVTFNINPENIEKVITPKTKAIMPVHLYGQCADMNAISEIAKKHNLAVIEDAAQAIGAEYKDGRKACSMGDIGCLSFFPSKNLGAFGDAGMVITNNEKLYKKMLLLRVHGAEKTYHHKIIGGNFRMDAIQAAVLNIKLKYLDGWTKNRRQNAENYERLFKENGLTDTVKTPKAVYKDSGVLNYHIYNQFIVRFPKRDELKQFLADNGIGSAVYYPIPFHLLECFGYLGYKKGDFVNSEKAAEETLALPIYPELTKEMQEFVVSKIKEFYK